MLRQASCNASPAATKRGEDGWGAAPDPSQGVAPLASCRQSKFDRAIGADLGRGPPSALLLCMFYRRQNMHNQRKNVLGIPHFHGQVLCPSLDCQAEPPHPREEGAGRRFSGAVLRSKNAFLHVKPVLRHSEAFREKPTRVKSQAPLRLRP